MDGSATIQTRLPPRARPRILQVVLLGGALAYAAAALWLVPHDGALWAALTGLVSSAAPTVFAVTLIWSLRPDRMTARVLALCIATALLSGTGFALLLLLTGR